MEITNFSKRSNQTNMHFYRYSNYLNRSCFWYYVIIFYLKGTFHFIFWSLSKFYTECFLEAMIFKRKCLFMAVTWRSWNVTVIYDSSSASFLSYQRPKADKSYSWFHREIFVWFIVSNRICGRVYIYIYIYSYVYICMFEYIHIYI